MESKKKPASALGRMDVQHKAVRIEDVADKVNVAVSLFEKAQSKFERGQDSMQEWKQMIALLEAEDKNIKHFIAMSHHNIGVIYAGQHNLKVAKECFLKAIGIDDSYVVAYYNLAVTFKELGDMEQAKKYYAKAKELGYSPPQQE